MSGNSRNKSEGTSSDYQHDLENMSSKGNYPTATRQVSRMEEVVLLTEPDYTRMFVQSVTDEVNGFSSRDIPSVEFEDMWALFHYAILAKLVFITHAPRNTVRDSADRVLDVRRLDDIWVLPGAFIPVLGSIGNIEGAHPVVYRPIITPEIVDNALLAYEQVDGSSRLERVERTLAQLERRGLLVARGIPRTREGNPDVMTAIMWERELYFRREGIEGVIAAITASIAVNQASWNAAPEETQNLILSTFIGRSAFGSMYLTEDAELCIREFARDFTRDRDSR